MIIVELNVCDYCPFHCKYCVAKTRQALRANDYGECQQNGTVLPMEQTLMWLAATFKPDEAAVLVTGGEPSIIPFGYEWSNRLVAMGYKTYILTNGYKMSWEARLWHRQARYLLTHHIEQQEWEAFDANVKAMIAGGHKNISLQTVITPQMLADGWGKHDGDDPAFPEIKARLAQYGFPWRLTGASKVVHEGDFYAFGDERYKFFESEPQQHSPSGLKIYSVRPDGGIHVCHKSEVIGTIYEPLDQSKGWDYKCYCIRTGRTQCSPEDTVLFMAAAAAG